MSTAGLSMDFREVRDTLANIGVFPDKRLGQTFLVDGQVAHREAGIVNASSSDTVLEVGPGLGILTAELCASAGKVVAVEKDRRLARHLSSTLNAGNLEVVAGDILEIDIPGYDIATGNLPYSVSSPIIFRLSEKGMARGVFMIQKEVAERAAARPSTSEYSRMSASLQRRYLVALRFEVGHSHFYPQPDVDSSVIELARREGAVEWPEFDSLVAVLFSHRRKKIGTVLRKAAPGYAKSGESAPFADRRVEELAIAQMEDIVSWLTAKGFMPAARR